ncbi:MAG: hypothetical protein ACR5LA_05495, partial [Wolbachia sp.]
QSKIILLHFYSLVTSLLFDNMFPEFTLFSSLFYLFLIRNWGSSTSVMRIAVRTLSTRKVSSQCPDTQLYEHCLPGGCHPSA